MPDDKEDKKHFKQAFRRFRRTEKGGISIPPSNLPSGREEKKKEFTKIYNEGGNTYNPRKKSDSLGRDEVGEEMFRSEGRKADRLLRELGTTPSRIPKRKLPTRKMR